MFLLLAIFLLLEVIFAVNALALFIASASGKAGHASLRVGRRQRARGQGGIPRAPFPPPRQNAAPAQNQVRASAARGSENLHAGWGIDLPNEMHMKAEFVGLDAILPYLGGRGWILVKAPPHSGGFVTSDRPVSLIWSEPRRRPIGFALRGTEVIFPLSNRLALMGAFDIDDEAQTASDEFVAEINGLTISRSRRQVYARDRNFLYAPRQGEPPRKGSRLITDRVFTTDDTE